MLLNFFTAPSLPPSLTSLILTAILQTGGKVVYTGLPKAHNKSNIERSLLVHTLETNWCAQRILFGFSAAV